MTTQATLTLHVGSADPFTVEVFDANGNAQSLEDVTVARVVLVDASDDGDVVLSSDGEASIQIQATLLVCAVAPLLSSTLTPGVFVGRVWLYFDTPEAWRLAQPSLRVIVRDGSDVSELDPEPFDIDGGPFDEDDELLDDNP